MRPPKCHPFEPALRYQGKTVQSLRYDGGTLTIGIRGDTFGSTSVIFERPAGFRVLDERDLCEFWNTYSEPNGWLYEVEEGGWMELETHRDLFNSHQFHRGLREYFVVDEECISVLAVKPPTIARSAT